MFEDILTMEKILLIEPASCLPACQKLVKDGLYKHIRHPLYLGGILRNLGIVSIFSGGIGILFIVIGTNTEEEMLVKAFGSDYEDYKRKTKRLIPFVY